MKLRGWVVVYNHADGTLGNGYWFSATPPCLDHHDAGKAYSFSVEVPDPLEVVQTSDVREDKNVLKK